MARTAVIRQTNLPRFERDGVTHALACECPRCDAGFRPSDRQRREAANRFRERRARTLAETGLDRMLVRKQARAMKIELALDEEAHNTNMRLEAQAREQARIDEDARLKALLELRASGLSISDALAAAERMPARRIG